MPSQPNAVWQETDTHGAMLAADPHTKCTPVVKQAAQSPMLASPFAKKKQSIMLQKSHFWSMGLRAGVDLQLCNYQ
jgi:hypothetical protein